jgi:hypothetical protein
MAVTTYQDQIRENLTSPEATELEKIEGPGVTRTGRALVKFNKLDSRFKEVSVREQDGDLYYYHTQFSEWYSLPADWTDRIRWND